MTLLCSLLVEIAFLNPLCASVRSEVAIVDDNVEPSVARVEVANLKDQLNAGLRARRPEEFRFIAKIHFFFEEIISIEFNSFFS